MPPRKGSNHPWRHRLRSSSCVTDLRRSISGFAVTHRLLDTSTRSMLSRLASITADPNDVPDCSQLSQSVGDRQPKRFPRLTGITWSRSPPLIFEQRRRIARRTSTSRITASSGSVFDRGHFAFTQHQSPACTWGYGTFTCDRRQASNVLHRWRREMRPTMGPTSPVRSSTTRGVPTKAR